MTGNSSIGEIDDTGSETGSDPVAGTSGDSSGTEGDGATGPGTGDDSGDPVASCADWSPCSAPLDCGSSTCGDLTAIDSDGCPRPFCESDDQCPDGYSCYRPNDWGACGAHECYELDDGTCECGFGLDCNDDAHCVPEDDVPPFGMNGNEFCSQFDESPVDCMGAIAGFEPGRCAVYEGWEIPADGSCVDAVPTTRCQFTRDLDGAAPWPTCVGDAELMPLWTMEDDTIVVIHSHPETAPAVFDPVPRWAGCSVPEAPSSDVCFCGCP